MNIYIMGDVFFGAADHMKLAMFTYFKPDMPMIVKRFRNRIQHHHFFIKVSAACEVRHINCQMIKMWFRLGPALKGKARIITIPVNFSKRIM